LALKISGVMPVHNEQEYLPYSLSGLKSAPLDELVVILDRCTDSSESIITGFNPGYPVRVYHKMWQKWRSKIAETFEYGFSLASGDVLYGLAADCVYDPKMFDPKPFEKYAMMSYQYYNRDIHTSAIRQNMEIFLSKCFQWIDFAQQVWQGGVFATKKSVWCELHFRDLPSEYGENVQFKDYCERLMAKGYKYYHVKTTKIVHLRAPLNRSRQVLEGKGRAELGYPYWRVLLHSLIHMKPYVLVGYIQKNRKY
jgi:glycosyltransferase involved in cell wall biosynthesis